MPDKKPTDSEIVKALELLLELVLVEGCLQRAKTISNALDLINHLQEKNSNLQEKNLNLTSDLTSLQNDLTSLKAENERLKENEVIADGYADALVEYTKAEAYKEFAELLHCQCENIINQPHNENVRPISWKVAYEEFAEKVDNLLKELVGE